MDRLELLSLFVSANEFKEGDLLVGGTKDELLRRDARERLSAMRIGEISKAVFIEDQVSETLAQSIDGRLAKDINHLTVSQARDLLLEPTGTQWARQYGDALTSEAIAAVVKVMNNDELSAVAKKLFNPHPGGSVSIGSSQHFGSRIQPNSPGDDEEEILFSILEGLAYGCGDVIIGLNPASDDLDTIVRLERLLEQTVKRLKLPTRYCVLSDIVKQTNAREQTRIDVGFQSLAGTSAALGTMIGLDVDGLLDLSRGFDGLYFETGQGSAVTNGVAEGADMVTLEARSYGLARHIRKKTGTWMIVNDVAGFIGPEVFQTSDQLFRACLEDAVMAKLHGITMGLDVCSTFHMGIEPLALQELTEKIVDAAAPAYLMAVAGNADPMLGYLTTSFRDHPRLRLQTGKKITDEMQSRLTAVGALSEAGKVGDPLNAAALLYCEYQKEGGEMRSDDALTTEGKRKINALRERGFDLGYGYKEKYRAPSEVVARMDAIFSHARRALYSSLDVNAVNSASGACILVRSRSADREDYLSHPPSGEEICGEDAAKIASIYSFRRPQVQIIVSDGLNANAVNENLRDLLPLLKLRLSEYGLHVADTVIVVVNGRVRAGYRIGALLNVDAVIHLIGERPGTGLNMLSAYLTYGRDRTGRFRWEDGVDHSDTTAICGINKKGKPPEAAANEIALCTKRMFEERCSGILLGSKKVK